MITCIDRDRFVPSYVLIEQPSLRKAVDAKRRFGERLWRGIASVQNIFNTIISLVLELTGLMLHELHRYRWFIDQLWPLGPAPGDDKKALYKKQFSFIALPAACMRNLRSRMREAGVFSNVTVNDLHRPGVRSMLKAAIYESALA
ncbi:hypothetical protein VARIO8X_110097 [Burkholderiales bacterium 8X]|nr:hypothetical protein VARIO8X_110097 [Burkholderiales bacterium 8X]